MATAHNRGINLCGSNNVFQCVCVHGYFKLFYDIINSRECGSLGYSVSDHRFES